MDTKQAVELVASKFRYKKDIKWLDSWSVMREKNSLLYGDCDDFAITCIRQICDRSLLKFLLFFCILHKYRVYFVKTRDGSGHAVGYANGYMFDNYSMRAMPVAEFKDTMGHKFKYPFVILLTFSKLLAGLFVR